jgi:3-methyladenine DNA glycosylase AlkD
LKTEGFQTFLQGHRDKSRGNPYGIISTFAFIQKGQGEWTFRIVKILMQDPNDLIHKACGWMLREVGKKISDKELKKFLDEWGTKMPRTMLRYAIEKFEEKERIYYLNKK